MVDASPEYPRCMRLEMPCQANQIFVRSVARQEILAIARLIYMNYGWRRRDSGYALAKLQFSLFAETMVTTVYMKAIRLECLVLLRGNCEASCFWDLVSIWVAKKPPAFEFLGNSLH